MAAQARGSKVVSLLSLLTPYSLLKVVLCTDGIANVGVGSLEGYDTLPGT